MGQSSSSDDDAEYRARIRRQHEQLEVDRQAQEQVQREARARARHLAEQAEAQRQRALQIEAEQKAHEAAQRQVATARRAKEELERPTLWKTMAPADLWAAAKQRMLNKGLVLNPKRYNIAIVGSTGAGKSSTINALLKRLSPPDASIPAAHVSGLAAEGTTELKRFDLPGSVISLWDVPGGGTNRFSAAAYVEEQCLAVFDMLVLLINERLLELHCDILKASKQKFPDQKIKVLCAKGDEQVKAARMDVPGLATVGQQAVVEHMRRGIVEAAAAQSHIISAADVFVISTWLLEQRTQPAALGLTGSLEEDSFSSVIAGM